MFVLETRVETQRWFVFKGWTCPLPMIDCPAESISSSVLSADPLPHRQLDDNDWELMIDPSYTDSEGWTYANNCTAFNAAKSNTMLVAKAHARKEMLDCVRQRMFRRRQPLAPASDVADLSVEQAIAQLGLNVRLVQLKNNSLGDEDDDDEHPDDGLSPLHYFLTTCL
jgi:hypothetical protein